MRKASRKSYLIVSDEGAPRVQMKPGMKFEVVMLNVVDEELKATEKMAARLCGGTTTCLALVDPDPS